MPQPKQHLQKSIESFTGKIICGDALETLRKFPDESVDCVVTSPPYWALRDYGVKEQIGLEPGIEQYLDKLSAVFAEVHRILKPAGTCWINFGDTYANKTKGGHRNKPQGNMYDSLSLRATFPKLKTETNIPPKSLYLENEPFVLSFCLKGKFMRKIFLSAKNGVSGMTD